MSSEYTGNNDDSQKLSKGASVESRTVTDRDVIAESRRYKPREVQSGVTRGTWRLSNTDGSYITLGNIPDTTEFGIAFFDADDNLIFKRTGVTEFVYDTNTGKNIIQFGLLPDGTYGLAVAKSGYDISEAITP